MQSGTNFRAVKETATKYLCLKRCKHKAWISAKTRELIIRKRASKTRSPQEYHQLNKETRASPRNDKKEWMCEITDELESAAREQDMRKMYQLKKHLINKPSKKATQVK